MAAIGVVLAFVPVAAVDLLLDNYVRQRETLVMQHAVDNIGDRIEADANDGIARPRCGQFRPRPAAAAPFATA